MKIVSNNYGVRNTITKNKCEDVPSPQYVYVTPKVQTGLVRVQSYRLGSWYFRPDVLKYQLSFYFRSWYFRTSWYSRSWYFC